MHIHDLIGIGFGPSNIALAIALEEAQQGAHPLDAFFIEKQPAFAWHPGMLLDHAHMQICYLKDLATLRNPRSRFTFVNYLHEQGRLPAFINLKTFYPSRREFSDYLGWAARQFEDICAYGEEVVEVLPEGQDSRVHHLRVRSRNRQGHTQDRLARNLVISVGGTARVPECFRPLAGEPRIFHSNGYLGAISALPNARKVAVIGAGQSAAEIFMHLHDRDVPTEVDLIMRARAMRPSDDSPFVNRIFDADFTDHVFEQDEPTRAALLQEFRHTNYAVPDLELIQQIYKILYEQSVAGSERHRLLHRHDVVTVHAGPDGVELVLRDLDRNDEFSRRYDAVVLATGYERQTHKSILAPIAPYLSDLSVDRSYRVQASADFRPAVFLQGACENSHGLSDTLLSVTPIRVREILHALTPATAQRSNASAEKRVALAG
ncbi:MAG: lysine N(6)-hydroxylase/L-ornithine N(5)-oxygenase family protein [Burkholderiaceae bacterium]